MENLHLKNLIQKPHPLIILQKLKDIEHAHKNNLPADIIIEINDYLRTLEFKNKEIETFITEFFNNILYGEITSHYNIPIQIITLLHKYKLNELDINSKFNYNEINTFVKNINNYNCMLTYESDSKLELVDLVPEKCLRIEEGINCLNKQISRKLRLLNPQCFNEKKEPIKGQKMTNRSNNLTKLMNRVQKKQRKMRIYRNELQNKVCNDLLSQGNVIQLEKMNVKALQKRSKNIRINPKTNKPYSKKRFGKSILKASPSSLVTLLKNKARSRGAKIIEINTKDTKPSQYNHILNDNVKKSLNTRIYDLSDEYPNVQRDFYSAILNKYTIQHTKNDKVNYTIDKTRLTNEFETYYKLMQNEITKIRNENKRLSWYVS